MLIDDNFTSYLAIYNEFQSVPSVDIVNQEFYYQAPAVCRKFAHYDDMVLNEYNNIFNDLVIDVFDISNDYVSQLVDF